MTALAEEMAYPQREAFFSHRFLRQLAQSEIAQEIGSLSTWLLTIVVLQEDAARYERAVTFWDGQLSSLIGAKSNKVLRLARDKAVELGWLHYEAGSRGRPGRYWVMVPVQGHSGPVEPDRTEMPDTNINSNSPHEVEPPEQTALPEMELNKPDRGEIESQSSPDRDVIELNFASKRERIGHESGINRARIGHPFLPIPIPNPIPNSEENRAPSAATGGELESPSRKSNSTKRRQLTASDVALPPALDSPEFRQALESWFIHRAEIRRPVTETSAKQLIKQLASIGRGRAIAAIEHSVAQGWQGVFEPTQGSQNGYRGTSTGSFNSGRYISPNADEDISRLVRVRASAAETDSGR